MLLILIFLQICLKLQGSENVCDSEECQNLSQRYLSHLSKNIQPCDDFYEFACENYANKNPIPIKSEQVRIDVLFEMKTELDEFIKKSLEQRSEGPIVHYKACLRNRGDLKNLVANFSEELESWELLSGNLSRLGIYPIIRNLVLVSFGNEDRNELMFADPKDFLNLPEVIDGLSPFLDALKINQTDIQEFQDFLKDSRNLRKNIENFSYINISSFKDFKKYYGNIKFDQIGLPDSTIVNNLNWPYFEALNLKIHNFSEKTIKDYLILNLMNEMKKYMEQDCLTHIKQMFPFFILKKIILPNKFQNFSQETKSEAKNLVNLIKNKMMTRIRKEEWIGNNETRSRALDKIEAMTEVFGFSEELEEEKVENLEGDKFFENIFKIKHWVYQEEMGRVGKKAEPDLRSRILDVQAFYIPTYNQMFFTAPILTPPLFAPNSPPFITYGALGTAIGHEITHGFDNRGSRYNKHGKSENWWDFETSQKFENRTECIREQYHKATEEFMGRELGEFEVPGSLLGENIADNGGLRLAYRVFEKQMEKKEIEGI